MSENGQKKTPMRMCIACRKEFPKRALIRVVRSPEGDVCVDASGKKSGRGAYVCGDAKCLERCAKGLLSKHLGCEIPQSVYEDLGRAARGEN